MGGRGAVFAPAPALAAIVVVDEHDERLQNEASPTWHARELAIERARRAGVPCLLVSPVPSIEARRAAGGRVVADRGWVRSGWPQVVVVDRRAEDRGRSGLFSPALVSRMRSTWAACSASLPHEIFTLPFFIGNENSDCAAPNLSILGMPPRASSLEANHRGRR